MVILMDKIINKKNTENLVNARLKSLDLLRGLAICGVIAVHSVIAFPTGSAAVDSYLGLGRFGVQLFFLISAFTMCHMWELRRGEESPVKKFYIRRLFRIAPLFWVFIPIYLYMNGVGPGYYAPDGIGVVEVVLTAALLHGLWPSSINSVVPGGWSIAVEVTFYIIFPFVISRLKCSRLGYLSAAIIIFFLYLFELRPVMYDLLQPLYQSRSSTIVVDYLNLNFLNQAPVFLIGCSIYFSIRKKKYIDCIALIIFWVSCSYLVIDQFGVRQFQFLMVYLFMGMIVYLVVLFDLTIKVIAAIGSRAYSMYLTHFLVLYALQKTMQMMVEYKPGFMSYCILFLGVILLCYVLADIIYRVIELRVKEYARSIT